MINSNAIDSSGYVTDKTRFDADAICREAVYNHLPKCIRLRDRNNYFDPNIDLLDIRKKFKQADNALLMFDRDFWEIKPVEMTDEDYEKQSPENYKLVIEKCLDLNYIPVLSTPLFEFWHHAGNEKVDVGSYKMDLGSSRNKISNLLRKLEGYKGDGKELSDERKRFYGNRFLVALNASRGLATNPMDLIENSGTNIGIILTELIGCGDSH